MGLEQGVTNAYPHMRHYVFSRTLAEAPDPEVEIVTADPVAKVKEFKREDGKNIWLCGGGSLAATLREEVDEIHLKLNPVVVGAGTPLFDGDFHIRRYSLACSSTFASGVVLLRYVRPEQSARP